MVSHEGTVVIIKFFLNNTEKQYENAKDEVKKPFAQEEELKIKLSRLDELNILLNLDTKGDDFTLSNNNALSSETSDEILPNQLPSTGGAQTMI